MHTPTPLDSAIMASMAGEASFQHLFMANPQPMWIFDLSTLRFLAVNQAALQHYGYSQAEFLDLTIRDIRSPEEVTRLLDVLSEQASPFNETGLWKHLTRDGRVIDVEVTTHLIQFAGQRAKLVLINDVSERLRAERALREHEARLRLFIEHAPVALAMFDRDMRYLAASRRWQDDYGLGHHPLDGRCHYEVFPEIGARWRELHQRGLQGEALNCEAERFVRQDGRVQWLRWTIHPWRDDQGDVGGIVIFTEDISERKRTEAGQSHECQYAKNPVDRPPLAVHPSPTCVASRFFGVTYGDRKQIAAIGCVCLHHRSSPSPQDATRSGRSACGGGQWRAGRR